MQFPLLDETAGVRGRGHAEKVCGEAQRRVVGTTDPRAVQLSSIQDQPSSEVDSIDIGINLLARLN